MPPRFPRGGAPRSGPIFSVPRHAQIHPGVPVAIILKADQPTGRRVQGTVADILTRGDHPRGVKVRLTDGRVGRVQALVRDGASADAAQAETTSAPATASSTAWRYRDVRLDEEAEAPPETADLSAYIRPAKTKKRRGGAAQAAGSGEDASASPTGDGQGEVVCPVCQDFRGDEAAVAFHVESHFK